MLFIILATFQSTQKFSSNVFLELLLVRIKRFFDNPNKPYLSAVFHCLSDPHEECGSLIVSHICSPRDLHLHTHRLPHTKNVSALSSIATHFFNQTLFKLNKYNAIWLSCCCSVIWFSTSFSTVNTNSSSTLYKK